jgi:uncharacterized membrane protein
MENLNNHQSVLRQKLDQHDLGYRPGAWENFEQMLNAAPIAPTVTKASFWNFKKWIGFGTAAIFLLGGIAYFNLSKPTTTPNETSKVMQSAPIESPANNAQSVLSEEGKEEKNSAEKNIKSVVLTPKEKSKITESTTTTKSIEATHHHDDNSQPHEGELKIKATPTPQRLSKNGSDDSGVLQAHGKKEEATSTKKNNQIEQLQKVPAAHDLDNQAKNKNKR